jgi:hypothetical protein
MPFFNRLDNAIRRKNSAVARIYARMALKGQFRFILSWVVPPSVVGA